MSEEQPQWMTKILRDEDEMETLEMRIRDVINRYFNKKKNRYDAWCEEESDDEEEGEESLDEQIDRTKAEFFEERREFYEEQ